MNHRDSQRRRRASGVTQSTAQFLIESDSQRWKTLGGGPSNTSVIVVQVLVKEVQDSDAELAALKLDIYEALQVCAKSL